MKGTKKNQSKINFLMLNSVFFTVFETLSIDAMFMRVLCSGLRLFPYEHQRATLGAISVKKCEIWAHLELIWEQPRTGAHNIASIEMSIPLNKNAHTFPIFSIASTEASTQPIESCNFHTKVRIIHFSKG